jgi:formylmethanofuran:tetrahydromethanopterin formyltransferase
MMEQLPYWGRDAVKVLADRFGTCALVDPDGDQFWPIEDEGVEFHASPLRKITKWFEFQSKCPGRNVNWVPIFVRAMFLLFPRADSAMKKATG